MNKSRWIIETTCALDGQRDEDICRQTYSIDGVDVYCEYSDEHQAFDCCCSGKNCNTLEGMMSLSIVNWPMKNSFSLGKMVHPAARRRDQWQLSSRQWQNNPFEPDSRRDPHLLNYLPCWRLDPMHWLCIDKKETNAPWIKKWEFES